MKKLHILDYNGQYHYGYTSLRRRKNDSLYSPAILMKEDNDWYWIPIDINKVKKLAKNKPDTIIQFLSDDGVSTPRVKAKNVALII